MDHLIIAVSVAPEVTERQAPTNKPRGVARGDDRRVLNGIFWVFRSCQIRFAYEK